MKSLRILATVGLVAGLFQFAPSVASVRAAAVSCQNGLSSIATPYTVSIDGVETAASEPGRYGKYWVLVCQDTSNKDYNVLAGLYEAGTTGGMGRFSTADLETEFKVSFLPDASIKPLVAQGHGRISSFSIDANDSNRVTIVTKPILYSDIYGNHCGNASPAECVLAVKTTNGDRASADNIEIRIAIRYTAVGTPAPENFDVLQGMHWSSSAYYFWMRTMCPTSNGANSSLTVEVGGPHLKADGTQNLGAIEAFLPTSAIVGCFGAPPSVVAESLSITRTENGTTADATTGTATDVGLQYTVTADDATGLTFKIPQVTFSKPKYDMKTRNGRALSRKTVTNAKLLSQARLKKPAGGSYKVTTKTSRICRVAGSKVYAWKAGTCKATVVTYNKKGKKVASRTVSFRVS